MHEQDLWTEHRAPPEEHPSAQDTSSARFVGLMLLVVTLGATYAFAAGLYTALAVHNGGTSLHYLFLGISTLSFSWIAFGAANAALGACALLAGTVGDSLQPEHAAVASGARTALLFPIYHEDPHAIADYIRSCARELEATNALGSFAVFVISDSQTEKDRATERVVFKQLAGRDRPSPYVRVPQ